MRVVRAPLSDAAAAPQRRRWQRQQQARRRQQQPRWRQQQPRRRQQRWRRCLQHGHSTDDGCVLCAGFLPCSWAFAGSALRALQLFLRLCVAGVLGNGAAPIANACTTSHSFWFAVHLSAKTAQAFGSMLVQQGVSSRLARPLISFPELGCANKCSSGNTYQGRAACIANVAVAAPAS